MTNIASCFFFSLIIHLLSKALPDGGVGTATTKTTTLQGNEMKRLGFPNHRGMFTR